MNKYQTVFTDEDFKKLPSEIKSEFYNYIENVPFIKWIIQPESMRGYAKDRVRHNQLEKTDSRKEYNDSRIVVDLAKPHVLEDMDFFRERAMFFDKHGKYTHLTPNPNPKSAYAKFWKKELKRWRDGLVRESDGEWIPGGLYFYWNYCPIWVSEEDGEETTSGKIRGKRSRSFPEPWLGDYLFFHYLEQARNRGRHAKLLKTRGVGFSFKMGSLSPRNMYIYPGSGNPNFHLASNKSYLQGDKGIFGKIMDTLDWVAETTPLPKLRLGDSKRSMEIQLGYQDEYGIRKGLLSSVSAISMKDDPDKARGLRGPLIHYEEDGVFPNLEDTWNINRKATEDGDVCFGIQISGGCVCAGTKVWTNNGNYINIEDLTQDDGILGFDVDNEVTSPQTISWMQPPTKKECVEIKTNYRTIKCSVDHPILTRKKSHKNTDEIIGVRRDYYKKLDKWYETPKHKTITIYSKDWEEAGKIKVGDVLLVSEKIDIWGEVKLFDARLVGMLIGDGSYGMRRHYGRMEYKTPCFSNCDKILIKYVLDNYSCNIEMQRPTKDGRLYHEISIRNLVQKLKDVGIAGQSKTQKRLPTEYLNLTKEDTCLLIAGLFDTDGYISNIDISDKGSIEISQSSEEILIQLKTLLEKLGIFSIIKKELPRIAPNRKDKNPWYTLSINKRGSILNFYENIPILIEYKKRNLQKIVDKLNNKNHRVYNTFNNVEEERVINVANIGIQPIYNLTAKENNTYLANNIITHNTGGSFGNDFAGSERLFYYPKVYNIYGVPNVYDKNTDSNKECGFFWGAYMNRKGCTDKKSGEPDVTKALFIILNNRYLTKNGAADSKTIVQNKAEECITPQDAIMRSEGSIFPVADLKDHLAEISTNLERFTSIHYIGNLIQDSSGEIKFIYSTDVYPIRDYPALDNTIGGIEIYELPEKTTDPFRFILGNDTYDDDDVQYSDSLGSVIVFDRWARRIVAEYTGRPRTANEFYEITYRLARYYNATIMYENNKKGLYAYFNNVKKSLHLLANTPEITTDKLNISAKSAVGNTSKGINATGAINAYGRRLQADWMLETAYNENVELDEEGNDISPKIPNYRKIRSVGYLKECIAWNPEINTDRISAMNMVMIYDVELSQYTTNGRLTKKKTSKHDEFFKRVYNGQGQSVILASTKSPFGYTSGKNNF